MISYGAEADVGCFDRLPRSIEVQKGWRRLSAQSAPPTTTPTFLCVIHSIANIQGKGDCAGS